MENYLDTLDRGILEELPPDEVRAYLVWKYWLEFAEKTYTILLNNNAVYEDKKKVPFRNGSRSQEGLVS